MDKKFWKNPVFSISAIFIFVLVVLGTVIPESFGKASERLYHFTTDNFGWFYLLTVFIIIVFLVGLAISKFGAIRLGGDTERPEYPFFTWIGMLFSAGFGVGLVFWGVAEPMSHYFKSPMAGVEAQTEEAARIAMGYSFFHWGISQWAIFGIVGLVIGFLQFRKKKDGLISTALEPLIGSNRHVKTGIDSFAVVATVMGIATSLGMGVLQMSGGLEYVFNIKSTFTIQLIIIAVVFVAYMTSASSGLSKGIAYLGNFNLGMAIALLLFFFIVGPKVFILETFTLAIGDYINNFITYSLRLQPYQGGTWVKDWTIFYWAWTIAWSPFVGAFVARVSKGRTIREFIMGVMVIPPAFSCMWIATLGGTALYSDLRNGTQIAEEVDKDVTSAIFATLQHLPMTGLVSFLAIVLIFTFLITSADSATYILASMTTRGSLFPPLVVKFVWGFLMTAIAAVLLSAGGLEALQSASLVSALPFTLLLLLLIFSLAKLLTKEPITVRPTDIRQFEHVEGEVKKRRKRKESEKEKKARREAEKAKKIKEKNDRKYQELEKKKYLEVEKEKNE
ncbi:BCCT family transporter [Sporosarcina sp. P26b]|uniref:BCCT family transporter n=1 Tax=Sporosarcina TaxID=1569 RepID=UPI000A17B75E|nr:MULTISPECIES: BCCT family transporter [Sporosarcina]ARK21590.1 glycine/betaine ABC transporter permease [Sporosarcina ureae]PIC74450.1 BCCT family transporter [Sporosarcina sp. P17b]PIC96599.1 BCCT family transporter [Sporosarcina sp. P26b]